MCFAVAFRRYTYEKAIVQRNDNYRSYDSADGCDSIFYHHA